MHAGGHNVIAGLFDHLNSQHPGSRLLGFLNGPRGILEAKFKEINAKEMVRHTPTHHLLIPSVPLLSKLLVTS